MGTRSLTYVYDESGNKIINMYRQFDGYPTGHGAELAEFLNSGRVVNGLNGVGKERQFNGAGCLAAQLVSHFKVGAGQFYLHPVTVEDCGQDYEYHIYTDGEIRVKIMDCGFNVFGMTQDETYEPLFEGTLAQFTKYCGSEKYGDTQVNVFENNQTGQDWLKSVLRDSEVTIKFEKNDGTERIMKCTLKSDLLPEVKQSENKKVRNVSNESLAVYDVEKNGWRSFRWDSIKSVEFGA